MRKCVKVAKEIIKEAEKLKPRKEWEVLWYGTSYSFRVAYTNGNFGYYECLEVFNDGTFKNLNYGTCPILCELYKKHGFIQRGGNNGQ